MTMSSTALSQLSYQEFQDLNKILKLQRSKKAESMTTLSYEILNPRQFGYTLAEYEF